MPREAITTDYADGWRAGWNAAQEADAGKLRAMAAAMRDMRLSTSEDLCTMATLDAAASAIERIPMPAPMRETDGLMERGA